MQTYQSMIDSGAPYIGSIPDEWDMLRASMLFRENKRANSDLSSIVPVQFKLGEIIEKPIDIDEKVQEEIKRYNVVNQDDIMVNGLNLNYDFLTQRVAIVRSPGCITPAYISMKTRSKILPMYACYLLKALDGRKVLNGWGTGIRLTLNFSEFKKYYLPVPPIQVQKKIVDYLDKETARIDGLIAKQERLLILLEEKRRSVITLAVMNDNWPKEKIKYITSRRDQKINAESAVHYIGLEHVESFTGKKIDAAAQSDPEGLTLGYKKNDVLFGKLRPYLAKVLLSEDEGICSPEFIVLNSGNNLLPEFLKYSLLNEQFIDLINSSTYGAKMPRANWEFIGNSTLSLPPLHEQEKILNRIKRQEILTGQLKEKVLTQIEILKERRTSLVSNVVTGKVKV